VKKFEFLEHTADVKIRVYGEDLKELFLNAVLAMAGVQKSKVKSKKVKAASLPAGRQGKKLKVTAVDKESLLINFLSQILAESYINFSVYFDARILKLSETEIEAEIYGEKVESFDEEIKAVTYHNVKILKKNGIWETVVVFDI